MPGILKSLNFYLSVCCLACLISCGIYSFKGGSLSKEIKTVSVELFSNKANLIVPSLAPTLTEKLKDKFLKEMNLYLVEENGDISFQGVITDYRTQPVSAKSSDVAATTRLTLTVKVTFRNSVEPQNNYDATFQSYVDFDAYTDLASVEDELIKELTDLIVQDIFNRAVNNW